MNGIVAINKPSGLTSSDVVVRVRNTLSKIAGFKVKCGHMGTLDPLASGVLLIGIGKCARLFDYFLQKEKSYRSLFVFGKTTATLDSQETVCQTSQLPKFDKILANLSNFVGEISQMPPDYSAKCINGVRAYKLARSGQEVELQAKVVKIHNLQIIRSNVINNICSNIELDIKCGSGTYIRSLCRDIAESCDTVGYMSYLIRTDCGDYSINDCPTMNEFIENPLNYIIPPAIAIGKMMPIYSIIHAQDIFKLQNGVSVVIDNAPKGFFGVEISGEIVGIASNINNKVRIVTTL